MTPAKIYPFSIPAGGSFPLLVIGDYAKILTSSGPLTLQGDTFGSIGPILAGQGVQDSPFKRLVLEDESGATNNGTILIADNAFIDDRITGSVEVIDGGKNNTLSNKSFTCWSQPAVTAGQYGSIHLYNPIGTQKRLVIKNIDVTRSTTGYIGVGIQNIADGVFAAYPASKMSGGTNSIAELKVKSGAASPVILNSLFSANIQAVVNFPKTFTDPIVINPGFGLCVFSGDVSNGITAGFEFTEEVML